MSCRAPVRPFNIETNSYGFAVAQLRVPDVGQGFRCGFTRCYKCRNKFVFTAEASRHTIPCVFCENETVWIR